METVNVLGVDGPPMSSAEERRLRVVANPAAGGGRARRRLPRLRQALDREGLEYDVRWTGAAGGARELAAEAVGGGCTGVVAVGGDGTVSACADALAGEDAALVVMPAGGGNDFAAAVGAGRGAEAAAAAAARGAVREVDLGRLGSASFANGFGLGLDGAIAARVDGSDRLVGKLGYVLAALREAPAFEPFHLEVDSKAGSWAGPTLLAGAANGPCHGGGFRVAPGAEVDDGALDLYRFGAVGRLRRLRELPRVRAGEHGGLDVFSQAAVTEATFRIREPVPAHLDGEVRTLEPGAHHVQVEPGALRVAVPPEG